MVIRAKQLLHDLCCLYQIAVVNFEKYEYTCVKIITLCSVSLLLEMSLEYVKPKVKIMEQNVISTRVLLLDDSLKLQVLPSVSFS